MGDGGKSRKPEPIATWFKKTLPNGWYIPKHVGTILSHLERIESGEIDRLAIHMPPRHGKSETVTIRFVLRFIELNPGVNVLVTGYNERFARKFSRRIRNMALERGLVSSDKSAADEWETVHGSLVMARGVGSPPTGTGFGLIVVDDPVRKREDVESEIHREKAWDWYTDDLYSRLEPGGAVVLVATLWHEDDVSARMIASEPDRWTVLKMPAISDDGKALWPERYPVDSLLRIRDVMAQNDGLRSWEALYQQNPTAREGDFFKVSQLSIVDALPAGLKQLRAWDKAASQGKGDYTAGVKAGIHEGIVYITHLTRGQWDTSERDRLIRQTAELDGRETRITGPQDPGAAGKSDAEAFVRLCSGFTVKTHPVSGDKELRAGPLSSQVNAGNVRLLKGDWNGALIEEFRSFPSGKHDDIVDAAADAFNELSIPTTAPEWTVY